MIAKALDPLVSANRRRQAGHDAEVQLAFYLKRAFEHDQAIRVLNGIRLEAQDDAAQLDHLVVHPNGMIVVESKSVYGEVKINDQGEWSRTYRGRYQGMPSAKLQADRQVLFLQRYLEAHAKHLRSSRATFAGLPIDVLVAVSDDAIIHRPQNSDLGYLVKAEQVPDRVTRLMAERVPKRGFLGFGKDGFSFADGELSGVTAFLRVRHAPLTFDEPLAARVEPIPPAAPARERSASPTTGYGCKYCQSLDLEVRWGHSYYFKCLSCDKNTPIARTCPGCGEKERVRKAGRLFFGECAPCGRSEQFYVNPA